MKEKNLEIACYNPNYLRYRISKCKRILCSELEQRGYRFFKKNVRSIAGKPDFVFHARKVAIFCDDDFLNGYRWENSKSVIKKNNPILFQKIEENMQRNKKVTVALKKNGWNVLRFWGSSIQNNASKCVDKIEELLHMNVHQPYRTIDLCAGIGGIRRGFELAGGFTNVLSAEIDKHACKTYEHLFGENPYNDITSTAFKKKVELTSYEILLAGFPCQTFSRVGLEEGFKNKEKGQIFFHIEDIISKTRPCAFLLENVDHLVTHNKGNTFNQILEILELKLNYKIIGVDLLQGDVLAYNSKSFIRNSRDFGIPQNRPRTYIIGFDREQFPAERIKLLPSELPIGGKRKLYANLNDVLEPVVEASYYMSSGYLETLIRHRERQQTMGNGFGYRVVNAVGISIPIANTLLATGGSGKERNLIYDPRKGIAGKKIAGKQTPLNDKGIRVMTPHEWGKLQGFINYAFLDEKGKDTFSFPENIPNSQRYKQFGNSVTIPVIEEMAHFIKHCLKILTRK